MMKVSAHCRSVLAAIVALTFCRPAGSQGRDLIEVDLELVLAVDLSLSMDGTEQRLQRDGYVSALGAPDVIAAVQSGILGKVAIAYLQWGGAHDHAVVVDWTVIDGLVAAEGFAAKVRAAPLPRHHRTAIGEALIYAADMIANNGYAGLRQVIDISGDGPNNHGRAVTVARDDVVARGIVINGLPISLGTTKRAWPNWFDERSITDYYRDCVIAGPGAFVLAVDSPAEFSNSIRRKLIAEIAGHLPVLKPALIPANNRSDICRIGEAMWHRGGHSN